MNVSLLKQTLGNAKHAVIVWGSLGTKVDFLNVYLGNALLQLSTETTYSSTSCINQTCLPCVKLLHNKPRCNYKTLVVPFMVCMVYCSIGWT